MLVNAQNVVAMLMRMVIASNWMIAIILQEFVEPVDIVRVMEVVNMSELYTIEYKSGIKAVRCSFRCACTVAGILDGVVIDESGKLHYPEEYKDLGDSDLGIAIASDVMMWRAIHKVQK